MSKPSNLIEVRPSRIEIEFGPEGRALRVGDVVRLRATKPFETDEPVACGIPGYDEPGTELVADELAVGDDPSHGSCRETARSRAASTTRRRWFDEERVRLKPHPPPAIRADGVRLQPHPHLGAYPSRCMAASNATADGAKSVRRTNASASWAPHSRSMPESSHSIESGPA